MSFLLFDKCCCCINLRIGALILGYLGLISALLMIGGAAMSMHGYQDQNGNLIKISAGLGWCLIIAYAISFFFYVLLLAGTYKNKPKLVFAAIIYMSVSLVISSILMFLNPVYQNASGIISLIIGIALSVYFILCVRSYYLVMKEEGFRPASQGGV